MKTLVPEPDIRLRWVQYYEPGLQRVLAKAPSNWLPADVYEYCRTGRAYLFYDQANPNNFIVVRRLETEFSHQPYLHVWIGVTEQHNSIADYTPAIDEVARQHGFSLIKFESPRPGYQRQELWRPVLVTYERDVPAEPEFDGGEP